MLRVITAFILILTTAFTQDKPAEKEADHEVHQELRGLLSGIEKALNDGNYEGIAPFFHKDLRITTITQETITSREGIGKYFGKHFGPDRFLKSIKVSFEADELTQLYGNDTYGIVRGHGSEYYYLSDGREYDMKIRWTATVIKDTDGKWRLLTFHSGTDFLSNPILNEAKNSIKYTIGGGLLGGALLGCLLMWLLMRKKVVHSGPAGTAV
jgi:ketosteroid isomerase-like protein